MILTSINIGQAQTLQNGNKLETTGIYKQPAPGPVSITRLGIAGDFIGSDRHHGGPDQAIYVYGGLDYDWWARELGREMSPGLFGENLTVAGLASAAFNIGDRLQVGGVTLEVTAPRIPCSTFAARMGDMGFVKQYRLAGRPGLYCRVLQDGSLCAGDEVTLLPYEQETLSVAQMFADYYIREKDEATLRRHLNAPIAIRARRDLEDELQKLLAKA